MNAGDIVCVKVTGEKVFILDLYTRTFAGVAVPMGTVRRPNVADGGGIQFDTMDFFIDELEPLEAHAERQVQEMVLKQNANSRFEKLMNELATKTPAPIPAEPKVN